MEHILKKNEGIAIVSSEVHFEKAFSNTEKDVMGGQIVYGDYIDESFEIDENNAFTPILHKRNSFSYENEYRLAYWDTSVICKKVKAKNGFFTWDGKKLPDVTGIGVSTFSRSENEIEKLEVKPGFNIKCDINELIERIYVSPLAEDWFLEVVKDVSNKYGLQAPITKSELMSEPLK